MIKNPSIDLLNALKNIPFEQWSSYGVKFKAVSASADGIVNSGILGNGTYFFRKHEFVGGSFTGQSEFVLS